MVIILVLGLLIVAIGLTTTFSMNAGQLEQFQRIAYSREANYQVARSAFELGLALLRVDDADVDGAEDLWATGPTEMTWEGRLLRLEVEDEERRFPVNALVPASLPPGAVFTPNEEQDALAKALHRLLEKQGVDARTAVPALVDWMDNDETPTAGGSEMAVDPAIAVKNTRLDSFGELRYVRGWTDPQGARPLPLLGGMNSEAPIEESVEGSDSAISEDPSGGLSRAPNASQWSDWLSLHSEGKVNINTAPREVLLCLDEQMTDALVEEIVRKRQEGSLSGEEDLRQIATIDEDLLFRLSRLIRYNSQYFRVRIGVSSPPGPIRVEAIVLRDRKNPRVIRWEVY